MLDQMEIRDEIEMSIGHFKESMPENIRRAAELARSDLFNGPIYLDAEGESVSPFDEFESQFNFAAACSEISEWCDLFISDISMETAYDPETDESEYVNIDGSRDAIMRGLFGRELSQYIA